MATIGSLAIKLTASAGQFVQGIGKADRSLANLTDTSRKFLTVVGLFKSAIAAVLVGALAAYAKHCIEGAAETVKLARSVFATTDGLVALQLQLHGLGGDAADAGAALGHLNEVFGSVDADADFAQQAMSRLGLSAADLAKAPTDQAFAAIADKLAAIVDPAVRAGQAYAIFGDKAGKVLPALSQGAKGMSDAAALAKQLGISIDAIQGAEIVQADNQLRAVGEIVRALGVQLAVELAPPLLAVVQSLKDMGINGKSMAGVMIAAVESIAKGAAFLVDAWGVLDSVIVVALAGWMVMFGKLGQAMTSIVKLMSRAPGHELLKDVAAMMQKDVDDLLQTANNLGGPARAALEKAWGGDAQAKVREFFDGVRAAAARGEDAMKAFNAQTGGASTVAFERLKKLFAEGKKVFESSMTPAQKFGLEMQKLNSLLSLGVITWDTYARAASTGLAELEKAHQLGEVRLPAGVERGTAAGVSAVNQAEALNERRFRETPEQRAARIVEQSLEIEKQQLEMQKRIAAALAAQPPIARF